jgi:hypothetical protein
MEGMEMNQSQQVEQAVGAYANAIDVPSYDESAIRRRIGDARTNDSRLPSPMLRFSAAAAAACALVAIFVLGSPAVRAQVERMLHAFAVVGGQTVPIAVNNSVTLDQARRDMPFAVIAPAAIPAGFTEQIDELNPTSRLDSRLVIRLSSPNGGPPVTIMESRAGNGAPDRMRLWMTVGTNAPPNPPALPKPESGQHMFVQLSRNGQVQQRVEVHPITWTARGTRVDLISPPGLLSPMQLAAIHRAMSL